MEPKRRKKLTSATASKRRPRGGGCSAASGLTAERIRDEALRLIDDGGLETFSTRKLGTRLGCEAMAIYWYYPSKELLLDAVAEGMMSELPIVVERSCTEGIDALRAFAHALRKLAHEHAHAFPLLATRGFAMHETYNHLLARHEDTDERRAAYVFHLVGSYCCGFVFDELASLHSSATADLGEEGAEQERAPASHAATEEAGRFDQIFDFGLEVILRGLSS